MKLAEYRSTIKTKVGEVNDIFGKADTESEGACSPDQIEAIKRLNHEIEELEVSAKSCEEQDALKAANGRRGQWLDTVPQGMTFPGQPESRGDRMALGLQYGQRFVEHPAFKAWFAEIAPNGVVSHSRQGQGISLRSPIINIPTGFKALIARLPDLSPDALEAYKALVTGSSATSGGPFVNVDYLGLLDPEGTIQRPLRIRDLVRVIPTDSDTVEYPRIGAHTNAAAAVAEATATSGASGAKPESSLVAATVTETVKTIAHWIPATRRSLQDASMLRGLIDSFLRYGLAEEVEDQMVSGSGVGENFTGVLNTTGRQTQAWSSNILTTTRKARTKVVLNGRAMPNAYILHPNDWETIDLLEDNEARYYMGGPSNVGTPRLWGVPVIESEAITAGTGLLGDWRFAVLFDRMQTAIYMSDQHSDFFVRNLIAILAELRAAFGVIRPAAFCEIDTAA